MFSSEDCPSSNPVWKVSQLSPLPARWKNNNKIKLPALSKIQSLRTCHCNTTMTLKQMENFSGTKCAHKMGSWLWSAYSWRALSCHLKSPSSNLTYLGNVLMSQAGRSYIFSKRREMVFLSYLEIGENCHCLIFQCIYLHRSMQHFYINIFIKSAQSSRAVSEVNFA